MPDFWEFPTVSMGLGPLDSIYQARFNRYLQAAASLTLRLARLGVPRRRRDGRARIAWRHRSRGARRARQPDVRHQLQPAAPRRPGARQRQDHPRTRGVLPRRRLERHQGDLGRRLGPPARQGRRRRTREQAQRDPRRPAADLLCRIRAVHPRPLLRRRPAAAQDDRRHVGRRLAPSVAGWPRLPQGLRRIRRGSRARWSTDRHLGAHHQGLDAEQPAKVATRPTR